MGINSLRKARDLLRLLPQLSTQTLASQPQTRELPPGQQLQSLQLPPGQQLQPLERPPGQQLQPLEWPPGQQLQPLELPPGQQLEKPPGQQLQPRLPLESAVVSTFRLGVVARKETKNTQVCAARKACDANVASYPLPPIGLLPSSEDNIIS